MNNIIFVNQLGCNVIPIYYIFFLIEIYMCLHFFTTRRFVRMHPLHVIRPSLRVGVFVSTRQSSKFNFKLTCIHVQIFTDPHDYYEKSVSYSFASFHKSIRIWWQIWMTLVKNKHTNLSRNCSYNYSLFCFTLLGPEWGSSQ